MNKLRILYQLSLADFRERTRRYSFLVTMIGVLFFGYLVITGQYTIQFGEYRSVYNSAWAGSLMAVCSTILMTIVGFYLIRGSIKRDRLTEVGQIIAATQMSGRLYITSKLASNIAALLSMVASLAVLAFVTLLAKNEAGEISLWAFLSPFLIICLPASVFVSSVAVFFDSARWLRGSAGNIIYLFLAEICVVMGMLTVPLLDLASVAVLTDSARAAAESAFPGEKIGLLIGFIGFDPEMQFEVYKTFTWTGIDWTAGMLQLRLYWMVLAMFVAGGAVLLFDRFDPASAKVRVSRPRETAGRSADEPDTSGAGVLPAYDSLCPPEAQFSLLRMVTAELKLVLKGFHWFWYAVAAALVAAQFAAPFDISRSYLVPASMVWPLLIWSSSGTREFTFGTDQLLFSSPGPLRRQFPAIWLSGLLIALASVGPMFIRAGLEGRWTYAATLIVAALFIPSVALALGTLSGSRKLFEVTYLMIWYVGSIDRVRVLDLLGVTDEAISASKLAVLVMTTIGSLSLAYIARRRQIEGGWKR